MAVLTPERIGDLLTPFHLGELSPLLLEQLSTYLDLLVRWNARMNLTAIRDPEQIVQRQFGESLFAADLAPQQGTLLDFGSGAGLPGIPMQLAHPALVVTLAESQGKKASFLREAVRTLGLSCEVWARRVEAMPEARRFDVVVMRAVDQTPAMLPMAEARVAADGTLLRFQPTVAATVNGWRVNAERTLPLTCARILRYVRL